MRRACLLLAVCASYQRLCAQRQEIGLTLGRLLSNQQTMPGGRFDLKSGTALQANYGIRLIDLRPAALIAELHVLASQGRAVESAVASATRDVATLYVTPGIRMKFLPDRRFAPYFALGGGYALYEQSTTTLSGSTNPAPRHIHRGVVHFGGGLDVAVLRWLALRFELRDFYSGRPALNIVAPGGFHNVVVGGSFVLKL